MEKLVLLSLVTVLMASCVGHETYPKSIYEDPDIENEGNNTGKEYNATVTLSELEGSWRKPCGPVDGSPHFDIVTISFSRSEFTTDIKNYIDAGCTQPYREAPNPTALIKFKLGNGIMLNDGTIVTEMNSRTMHSDGADFYPEEYNIIYIKNGTFYAGVDDQDTTLQRPTRLDYKRPFHKVN